MSIKEWNIRKLRKEDLDHVGGWINALSGVPAGNYLQAINLLKMEWVANQTSGLGEFFIVSHGGEAILHITVVKLFSKRIPTRTSKRPAIIFVLMNPDYDEDEIFWFNAWQTVVEYFYNKDELTKLRVRIAQSDVTQIGALKRLGFTPSALPGEYVGDLRSWSQTRKF